jgi:hypothetical protein
MPPFFAAKRWQLPSDLASDAADAMAVDSLDGWDADELTMNGSRCAAALVHAQHGTYLYRAHGVVLLETSDD